MLLARRGPAHTLEKRPFHHAHRLTGDSDRRTICRQVDRAGAAHILTLVDGEVQGLTVKVAQEGGEGGAGAAGGRVFGDIVEGGEHAGVHRIALTDIDELREIKTLRVGLGTVAKSGDIGLTCGQISTGFQCGEGEGQPDRGKRWRMLARLKAIRRKAKRAGDKGRIGGGLQRGLRWWA